MDPISTILDAGLSRQNEVNRATAKGTSNIQNFYKDSVIFITGGTGFLGKHLVEKLLRSCSLKEINLLIRPKKGKTSKERIEDILKDSVFDTLRKENSKCFEKLTAVEGDVTEIGLGINNNDRKRLTNEVNMVFHAAATTRFDVSLKQMTYCNVRGTREIITLAKECKNFRSFVYVSTAFCQAKTSARRREISEEFYPSPVAPDFLIDMVDNISDSILEKFTPELIEGWPNTYTFTKAVTEELVRISSGELPICIVRPTIVISAYTEPSVGWLDKSSVYSATGLVLGSIVGMLHVLWADSDIKVDVIPVDMVNNAVISAGWVTADRWEKKGRDIKIYTAGNYRNQVYWGAIKHFVENLRVLATPKTFYHCGVFQSKHESIVYILYWLLHFIPAYFIDVFLMLVGSDFRLSKFYTTAWKMSKVLSYFTKNEWLFRDDNTRALYQSLAQDDKIIYNFDTTIFNWKEFVSIWIIGMRKHIIKDELKDTELGIRKLYWFKYLNYVVASLYAYAWWKVLTLFVWFFKCLI